MSITHYYLSRVPVLYQVARHDTHDFGFESSLGRGAFAIWRCVNYHLRCATMSEVCERYEAKSEDSESVLFREG